MENGYRESHNGKFRDKCLKPESFHNLGQISVRPEGEKGCGPANGRRKDGQDRINYGWKWGSISNPANFFTVQDSGYADSWRTEWDSNPRYAFTHTRFPSVRLKPLGHLSRCRS